MAHLYPDCYGGRIAFIVHIYESRAGQVKYMGTYYHTLPTEHLKKLRSQKYNRVQKLKGDAQGYFHTREIARLEAQMRWLDAVLAARASQPILL